MDARIACPSVVTLQEALALLVREPEYVVVFDQNVSWVLEKLLADLPPARAYIGLDATEENKTPETVLALERQLMEADISRSALLLAVGGGITTDVAGFAAAIYKRGIRYANFPTTLLAQVDAALGGKTGVNLDHYKNMLGAFCMPEFTVICPQVLDTLPLRERRAGMAEMLKTFLLKDAQAYAAAVQGGEEIAPQLILRAAGIKADIVSRDPFEKGERALLNLGHTFGHAIEHLAQEKGDGVPHAEAVAMGIILSARLSEKTGLAAAGLAAKIKADFDALGLPTRCPYPTQALGQAMQRDKKAGGGKVKFILLKAPGEPHIQEMTVNEALDDLR